MTAEPIDAAPPVSISGGAVDTLVYARRFLLDVAHRALRERYGHSQ